MEVTLSNGDVRITASSDEMADLIHDFEDALAEPGKNITSSLYTDEGLATFTVRCES